MIERAIDCFAGSWPSLAKVKRINPEAGLRRSHDDSLKRALNESVMLCDHDPLWATHYASEAERVRTLLKDELVEIRHIGSTSVPGLLAKPVIDMLAGIREFEKVDRVIERLRASGYAMDEEGNRGLVDRRWVLLHEEGRRTHHLHLVHFGGNAWRSRCRFCELLRADAALRREYARLKRELQLRFERNRAAYTAGKGEFILHALERDAPLP